MAKTRSYGFFSKHRITFDLTVLSYGALYTIRATFLHSYPFTNRSSMICRSLLSSIRAMRRRMVSAYLTSIPRTTTVCSTYGWSGMEPRTESIVMRCILSWARVISALSCYNSFFWSRYCLRRSRVNLDPLLLILFLSILPILLRNHWYLPRINCSGPVSLYYNYKEWYQMCFWILLALACSGSGNQCGGWNQCGCNHCGCNRCRR